MSGLTNTTGMSFLGLTNLTGGNFDDINVNDFTATTATIGTLSSTTGTITTLNSTTATLTTLNSTNINTTGILVSGLTSSKLVLTDASKNLVSSSYTDTDFARLADDNIFTASTNTFNNVLISPTYALRTGTINTPSTSDSLNIAQNTTSGTVKIGDNLTSANLTLHNTLATTGIIALNTNTTIQTNKNLTLGGTGKILSNTYTGLLTSSNINLGESGDTGNLTVNKNLFCQNIFMRSGGDNIEVFNNSLAQIAIGSASSAYSIVINQPLYIQTNKNLTLNGTGKITTPAILVSGLTASKMVLTDASKNLVSSLYTDTDFARLAVSNTFTGNANTFNHIFINPTYFLRTELIHSPSVSTGINIADNTTTGTVKIGDKLTSANLTLHNTLATTGIIALNTNTTILSNKNLRLGGTGKILTPRITGTLTTADINIGDSGDTGIINAYRTINILGGKNINLNNASSFLYTSNIHSWNGTADITFYTSLILTTGKNLTLSGTGKITTPNILVSGLTGSKLTKSDGSNNIISSLYDETTLPVSTPQQTALNLKANINAPVFTTSIGLTSGDLTISSGKLVNNTYQGISPADGINLFSATTSLIDFGNPSSTSVIRINQNTSLAVGKILRTSFIYPISTVADLYIGDQANDSGKLAIELNMDLHSSRKLKLNNTTASKLLLTNASKEIISSIYDETTLPISTPTQTALNLKANINAPVFTTSIGLTSGDLTLSNGRLITNTLQGISNASSINLFGLTTTGDVRIAEGLTTADLFLHNGTGSGVIKPLADLIFPSTKRIRVDRIVGSTPLTSDINLGYTDPLYTAKILLNQNTTVDSTRLLRLTKFSGNTSSANITIGDATSDTGIITSNRSINIDGGKNITLSSTGSLICNTYNATSLSSTLELGKSTTSGNIYVGSELTSGSIALGKLTMSGGYIFSYGDFLVGTGATPKKILCNTIESFAVGTGLTIGGNITTGSIQIGGSQSSGSVQIGNSTAGSDTGSVQCNKNLIMGDASGLFQKSISSNYYNGRSATSEVAIASNTTSGIVTIGESSSITPFTGGTLNYSYFAVGRYLGVSRKFAYTNVGYGNASTPTLFKGIMSGKYLTSTMWASAATSEWCSFESDTAGEGSAFIQNGDTSCIINPGDQSVLWWLDEDTIEGSPAGSTTYNWSGWKISTAGVFTLSSDRRLKRDITPIIDNNILDKLSKIEIVNYKWKAPTEEKYYKNGVLRRKYQEVHTGYIAQDVRKIFPECVDRETDDAYWTIKREDITSKFNLGVQELIKENRQQQKQIDDLTSKATASAIAIDDLTTRLTRLEQLLIPPV
jgi:hypothetical protein